MVLYKYRTDTKNTENIIKDKKVWFANPKTLNDPLECSIQEISEKSISKFCDEERQEHLQGLVMAYIMTPPNELILGVSKETVKKLLDRIGLEKNIKNKYKLYSNFIKERTGHQPNPVLKYMFIEDILNMIGIFSMSETCENKLMWGHYAEGGKGIAIGFELSESSGITEDSICLKVNYVDSPVILSQRIKPTLAFYLDENGKPVYFHASAFDDPFVQTVMSTKNRVWSYEKEWRCIEQIAGLKNTIAPIKEIVFGPQCPKHVREKYISLVEKYCDKSVSFFEIVMKGRTFSKQELHFSIRER